MLRLALLHPDSGMSAESEGYLGSDRNGTLHLRGYCKLGIEKGRGFTYNDGPLAGQTDFLPDPKPFKPRAMK
jgi:hypothetical protein